MKGELDLQSKMNNPNQQQFLEDTKNTNSAYFEDVNNLGFNSIISPDPNDIDDSLDDS